jgi:hypothetical protein
MANWTQWKRHINMCSMPQVSTSNGFDSISSGTVSLQARNDLCISGGRVELKTSYEVLSLLGSLMFDQESPSPTNTLRHFGGNRCKAF